MLSVLGRSFRIEIALRLLKLLIERADVANIIHRFALLDIDTSLRTRMQAETTRIEILEVVLLEDVQFPQKKETMGCNKDLNAAGRDMKNGFGNSLDYFWIQVGF